MAGRRRHRPRARSEPGAARADAAPRDRDRAVGAGPGVDPGDHAPCRRSAATARAFASSAAPRAACRSSSGRCDRTPRRSVWQRWAGPVVTTTRNLQESWFRTQQFQGNETGQLRALTGLEEWQVYFFQGNAWANCQSTGNVVAPADDAGRFRAARAGAHRRSCCRSACASSSASRRAAASPATSSATRSSRHDRSFPHRLAQPPARRRAAHGDDHRRAGRDARRLDGLAAVARDPGRSRRARAHAVGVDPLGRARLGAPDPARGRQDRRSRRQRRSPRRAVGGAARRSAAVDLPRRRQGQHRRRARRLPVGRDHRRDGALQPDATCSKPPAAASTRASWRCCERLCETVGVSTDIATRIATGLRDAAPPAPPAPGASAPPLRSAPPTRRSCRSRPRQLAWLGIDAESLRALDPYVVLIPDTLRLPTTARVNVNTAPREVLVAVVDKLDLATAERIVQARQRAPLKGIGRPDGARAERAGGQPEPARVQLELLRGARAAAPRRRRPRAALARAAQRARRSSSCSASASPRASRPARKPRQSENQYGDFAARCPPKSLIAKGSPSPRP